MLRGADRRRRGPVYPFLARMLLPASCAPLGEVRALGAQRGVLPVPRVDPRVVRQDVEDPLLDVVDQAGEALGVLLRVAHAAGEEAVAGEHVRAGLLAAAPDERDAARRVPTQ